MKIYIRNNVKYLVNGVSVYLNRKKRIYERYGRVHIDGRSKYTFVIHKNDEHIETLKDVKPYELKGYMDANFSKRDKSVAYTVNIILPA